MLTAALTQPAPAAVPAQVAQGSGPIGVGSGPGLQIIPPPALTAFGNQVKKFGDDIHTEVQKLQGQGEQMYNKVNALPVGQKVALGAGAVAAVAATGAAIGGIAGAVHDGEVKNEEQAAEAAKKAAREAGGPKVVTVVNPVPVVVQVTPAPTGIFSSIRLFNKDGPTPVGIGIGAFVGIALVALLGFVFLGLYMKKRSSPNSRSMELAEDEDQELMLSGGEYEYEE